MGLVWYEEVSGDTRLSQGDLIYDCPIVAYKSQSVSLSNGGDAIGVLRSLVEISRVDAIVMTQACDLEEHKVRHVILCPHYSLQTFRDCWERKAQDRGQSSTERSWRKYLDRTVEGKIYNLTMLNLETGTGYTAEHRIVDFQEVFSVPRDFLESWLAKEGRHRLRLRPPYREHLSQAFARFFMRVGLPTDVERSWNQQ